VVVVVARSGADSGEEVSTVPNDGDNLLPLVPPDTFAADATERKAVFAEIDAGWPSSGRPELPLRDGATVTALKRIGRNR
jgi:hypothetical protein